MADTAHQRILAILDRRWIDMGGGREKTRKRELPPIAYDRSPCFFVQALPTDKAPKDVGVQYLTLMHKHPRSKLVVDPTTLAWHVIAPGGATYFICYWVQWNNHTVPLFEEFCRKAGRAYGALTPDRLIDLGTRKLSFLDCELVHEDDVKPEQPTDAEASEAARDVPAAARKMLRSKQAVREDLESESFRNDAAAHDHRLHERLRRKFVKRLQAVQKELSAEFGAPAETGDEDHDRIPVNGVIQYALWKVKGKELYLAASHEDVELPYALVLGTV